MAGSAGFWAAGLVKSSVGWRRGEWAKVGAGCLGCGAPGGTCVFQNFSGTVCLVTFNFLEVFFFAFIFILEKIRVVCVWKLP